MTYVPMQPPILSLASARWRSSSPECVRWRIGRRRCLKGTSWFAAWTADAGPGETSPYSRLVAAVTARLRRSGCEILTKLQIRITQLTREGSPSPDLRPPQAKLSRISNQVAHGRIRQFDSSHPSHADRSPHRGIAQWLGEEVASNE